jgi:hypothetical protein
MTGKNQEIQRLQSEVRDSRKQTAEKEREMEAVTKALAAQVNETEESHKKLNLQI